MLYDIVKNIREKGSCSQDDLKELEDFLTTGPIKYDNSRFYKNVEFIKRSYDILDYVTREIDVSHIENEKLAEIVFYFNVMFGKVEYYKDTQSITFKYNVIGNDSIIDSILFSSLNHWERYYKNNEEPFESANVRTIHKSSEYKLTFKILDDKILDLILFSIYKHKIFKEAVAMPNNTPQYNGRPLSLKSRYRFYIDNKEVYEYEFKQFNSSLEDFRSNMIDKYKIEKDEA